MSRPLAEVLLDLVQAERDREATMKALETAQREGNNNTADRLETESTERDNRLDDLREEYRAVFRERTGVQWSNVEAALMSGAL